MVLLVGVVAALFLAALGGAVWLCVIIWGAIAQWLGFEVSTVVLVVAAIVRCGLELAIMAWFLDLKEEICND